MTAPLPPGHTRAPASDPTTAREDELCRCGHYRSLHDVDDEACHVWRQIEQGRLYCPCGSFDPGPVHPILGRPLRSAVPQVDDEESTDLTPGVVWTDAQLAVVRDLTARAFKAEAAIERVEALCAYWDDDSDARYSQNRIAKKTASQALRHALDGHQP